MQENCFGFRNGKCEVIKSAKFRKEDCNENCSFFKTVEQHKIDVARSYESIARLPELEQVAISQKYYHGKMPWKIKSL